jgi:small subunit ribosomal protein S6
MSEKATKYELMVIIKPLLPEDTRATVQKKLANDIAKYDGKILETDVWGKRHLAYKIEQHSEGYYIVYKLELSPATIGDLEKSLSLNTDIIRYLLTKI